MHTLIEMDAGVVRPRLVACDGDNEMVSERRWRAVIRPAILLLRAAGGGSLFVPHRRGDLAP